MDIKKEDLKESIEQANGNNISENIETTDIKAEDNGDVDVKKDSPEKTEELHKKILHQIEYYFGNYNHPRDRYLNEQIKQNDGWMPLDKIISYKRMSYICKDTDTILKAIEPSSIIEIDENREKIRRSVHNPLPPFEGDLKEESYNKTVYVKGFPQDGSIELNVLLEYFKEHGPVETIYMRNFFAHVSRTIGFKGSILVVFETRELAETFLKKEDLKYNSTPVSCMWYEDYKEEKKKEMEERVKRRNQFNIDKDETPIPKGTFLHMSDIPAGTRREDIRDSIRILTQDVAYIGYMRDQIEGYLRFKTEGCNEDMLSLLQGKLKVKDTEITLRIVEGDEEEAQINSADLARMNSRLKRPAPRNWRYNNRFGHRGGNKRRRWR